MTSGRHRRAARVELLASERLIEPSRFLDDLTTRLPDLRLVTVGRHHTPRLARSDAVEVPSLTLAETTQILHMLAAIDDPALAVQAHEWTGGIAQLVSLAAPWLTTASPEEITGGLAALSAHDSVQAFLLDWLTGLMDNYDRDVLEAASVFRFPFTDEALAALTDRTLAQISDVCRRLVRYHIASRGRSDDVAFVHCTPAFATTSTSGYPPPAAATSTRAPRPGTPRPATPRRRHITDELNRPGFEASQTVQAGRRPAKRR